MHMMLINIGWIETLAMRGLFLANLGRREEGYETVRQAIKIDLKSHVCWHVFGILYRSDKNYDEALKCYRSALRFDKDNFQILRDLAVLQMHLRQYTALCETRYQLLALRPVMKANWISLAIAYHLAKRYAQAVGVIDAILTGFPAAETANKFFELERVELVLYKAMILEEGGEIEAALNTLEMASSAKAKHPTYIQKKAHLLTRLERMNEARLLWREIFDYNSDSLPALHGLLLTEKSQNARFALLLELSVLYPKSLLLENEILSTCPSNQRIVFLQKLILPKIQKGVVNSVKFFCKLYRNDESDLSLIELLHEHKKECVWIELLLAEYYSKRVGDHELALASMERLFEEYPKSPEVLLYYARNLKRAGQVEKAAYFMDQARCLDLSDRYLNAKATKYALRAGDLNKAKELVVMFLKKGESGTHLQDLVEMQVMWYAYELALAHQRRGEHQLALQYVRQIVKHFDDFYDDQFDFHSYIVRRSTFTDYIRFVRHEDILSGHGMYKKAVKVGINSALHLQAQKEISSVETAIQELAIRDGDENLLNEAARWVESLLINRATDPEVLELAFRFYQSIPGAEVKALRVLYRLASLGKKISDLGDFIFLCGKLSYIDQTVLDKVQDDP